MSESSFRRTVWLILAVAAALRLGFLCFGEVLPVMWDQRRYAAAAIGVIARCDSSGLPTGDTEREDGEAFLHYYQKYVQGEQIDWMHYRPHKLSQARDELYTSGPVYPAFMAMVFAITPWEDFTVVRLFTIAGDVAATLLLMLVAVRLVGRRAALVAGAIYAIYFPLVLISTMLLLESSTTLMILTALYLLIRATESGHRRALFGAGLLIGLLVLHKPTAMLLAGPLLLGWYLYSAKGTIDWRSVAVVILPAILLASTWTVVASTRYGQLTLRDPSYASINLRLSSSIENEGYGTDNAGPDFDERQVYDRLTERFPEYVGLFAKKFERMFSRPYNDFQRPFLWPLRFDEWFHVVVLSFGMIGLLSLGLRSPRRAAWPLLIVGYYSLIHVTFHSTCRYSLSAIPMLFMGAGYVVRRLSDVSCHCPQLRRVALALTLLAGAWILGPQMIPGTPSYWLTMLAVFLKMGLSVAGLVLLGQLLLPEQPVWKKSLMVIVTAGVFSIMTWSALISRDAWAEFSMPLDDPDRRASTRIYISELGEMAEDEFLMAIVDVRALKRGEARFTISAPGSEAAYVLGSEPLLGYFYPYPVYPEYARLMSRGIDEFPQYAVVSLDPDLVSDLLERQGYVDLTIAPIQKSGFGGASMEIGGRYGSSDSSGLVPSPRQVSIERWIHRGDPRLRLPVKFLSDSAVSYYIGSGDPATAAETEGGLKRRLEGRFNMFLVHYRRDYQMLFY